MTKEQAIKTAVKWWSNKLRGGVKHDNGDNSFTSLMACALADQLSKPITDEQLEVFEAELTKILEVETSYHHYVMLTVDYNPCMMLYDAAKAAGISEHNFPYKTDVIVMNRDGEYTVQVSDGYGRSYETLNPVV
jgi:hypothetical protein